MNRIRVITCVQGREALTKAFIWQLQHIRAELGIDLPLSVAVSEEEDKQLIEEVGLTDKCNLVVTPNSPLSEKHNKVLQSAMREKDWDLLLHLGSDDIVSVEYVKALLEMEIEENTIYGVREIYFYNPAQEKMKKFAYIGDRLIGAGRVFPRQVLELTKGKKWVYTRPYYGMVEGSEQYIPDGMTAKIKERKLANLDTRSKAKHVLWVGRKNSGLDQESGRVLRELGVKEVCIENLFNKPQIIDIKLRGENITPWERIGGYTLTQEQMTSEFLRISASELISGQDEA